MSRLFYGSLLPNFWQEHILISGRWIDVENALAAVYGLSWAFDDEEEEEEVISDESEY